MLEWPDLQRASTKHKEQFLLGQVMFRKTANESTNWFLYIFAMPESLLVTINSIVPQLIQ